MSNSILIDSGFLYELYNKEAAYHEAAREFIRLDKGTRLIPQVILSEVTFLFGRSGGERAVIVFLETLEAARPPLVSVTLEDLKRARQIMATYYGAKLDFVDCCIMALSERLNITRVCTFDRRDFSMFRPKHCPFLELLP
ncbi:MAG: PIN domain-containing protein [Anaerolineae bacterium]|nr:PIN domain-containing protein [Anaerolineae bacterium]